MKLYRFLGFVVCGWLIWTGTVHADAVTDWNAIAVQALVTTTPLRPGPLLFLDLADEDARMQGRYVAQWVCATSCNPPTKDSRAGWLRRSVFHCP
jgi:hypothetical protein